MPQAHHDRRGSLMPMLTVARGPPHTPSGISECRPSASVTVAKWYSSISSTISSPVTGTTASGSCSLSSNLGNSTTSQKLGGCISSTISFVHVLPTPSFGEILRNAAMLPQTDCEFDMRSNPHISSSNMLQIRLVVSSGTSSQLLNTFSQLVVIQRLETRKTQDIAFL